MKRTRAIILKRRGCVSGGEGNPTKVFLVENLGGGSPEKIVAAGEPPPPPPSEIILRHPPEENAQRGTASAGCDTAACSSSGETTTIAITADADNDSAARLLPLPPPLSWSSLKPNANPMPILCESDVVNVLTIGPPPPPLEPPRQSRVLAPIETILTTPTGPLNSPAPCASPVCLGQSDTPSRWALLLTDYILQGVTAGTKGSKDSITGVKPTLWR